MSPLDACAEFPKDDYLWNLEPADGTKTRSMDAAYVTLDDLHRPKDVKYHRTDGASFSRGILSEHDTVGIRQIIRLLLAHGSDIASKPLESRSGLYNHYPHLPTNTHLDIAVASGCEVLVDELLHEIEKQTKKKNKTEVRARYLTPQNAFLERYLSLKSREPAKLLDGMVQVGQTNSDLFQSLLRTENEQAVLRFRDLGADLFLTQWGYADLLAQIGLEASVVNERPDSATERNQGQGRRTMGLLLHAACERTLPNLEVIKVLVEKLKVDVNAIDTSGYHSGSTALHVLARSSHWWQAGALEYLIDHGAQPDAKDSKGFTPLRVAVENRGRRIVEILLRYGADCNALGGDGLSCLNKAGADSEILRLLIDHGADVNAGKEPFIFDAIDAVDLDIVRLLVQMGTDCNISMTLSEREMAFRYTSCSPRPIHLGNVNEKTFPIHFASSARYNTRASRPRMIPIIECLLKGGANPFRAYNNTDPILHDLCNRDGIVEPLLEIPNIDLEARDSHGRTLLLAACSRSHEHQGSNEDLEYLETMPTPATLLISKGAKIEALDTKERNALHCILASTSKPKLLQVDFDLLMSHPLTSALINQADDTGSTALLYALENQHFWAIDVLLERGADPGYADNDGTTALRLLSKYLASSKKAEFYFQKFLSLGIHIDARTSSGESPLFLYMTHSTHYLKHLLLFTTAGADVFATNRKGQNLLHIIARKEVVRDPFWGEWQEKEKDLEVEIFCHLMEVGLDVTKEDDEQRTPLDLAVAAGNKQILGLFERKK